MTLKSSPIFRHLQLLKLVKNMRLKLIETDPCADENVFQYRQYLQEVGEGRISQNE